MNCRYCTFFASCLLGLINSAALAQTSFPMLASVFPAGGQRGQTVEVSVTGGSTGGGSNHQLNFYGAYKVLFEGRGLSATVVPPEPKPPAPNTIPDLRSITLRVAVAPDAEIGIHEFRVVTPRGASSVGQFIVSDDPEVNETEPNNSSAQANAISIPITVNGRMQQGEDIDSYKFKAEAGQTIAFHVLSGRLQNKIHDLNTHVDPMISILDAKGREIASNDDFFKADPYLIHTFAETGDHIIQIRDVRYQGNQHWSYRLTMTNKPYLTSVYPMGVQRGANVDMELVGTGTAGVKKAPMQVAADMETGKRFIQVPTANGMSNSVPIYVSEHPQTLESEENDNAQSATSIEIPCVANGRMDKENDVDFFTFTAQKGQSFQFQVMARQLETLLDSHLTILNAEGRELASNDDSSIVRRLNTPDSTIEAWTAPADGEYYLRIRDLHNRGGESFAYLIICRPQEQDIALRVDPDKAMLGPGGIYPMFIILDRLGGFTGEVTVSVEGLPKGVTASTLTLPAGIAQGVVFLQAANEAPVDATNVHVIGTTKVQREGATQEIRRIAAPMQEVYFPGGGRGVYPVHLTTVAVMPAQDIFVEVSPQQVTLSPGGSATIDVTIKRNNLTKPVSVDVMIRHLGGIHCNPLPPGVTITDLKIIAENETKTQITLKAADNAAPITNWPIPVLGQVSINFVVKNSFSAPPLLLTVTPKK